MFDKNGDRANWTSTLYNMHSTPIMLQLSYKIETTNPKIDPRNFTLKLTPEMDPEIGRRNFTPEIEPWNLTPEIDLRNLTP